MEGYFEDAASMDYSLTQKYPFYTFINSASQKLFPMAAHWHFYVEILYCIEGHGKIIMNGHPYHFQKNNILFAFPRDVHTINTIHNDPLRYVVIKLDPNLLFDTQKDAFMFKHYRQLLSPIPPELQLLEDLPGFDHEVLFEFHELFYHKPANFEWQAKSLIFNFFYAYNRYLTDQGYAINGHSDTHEDISSITPAFTYIHENFAQPITAANAAEYCHLSYSYFSRQFKKITGIPFTQYLNFIRVTEAERLLLEGKTTITDVGYKVGFSDTSYFIRQFKSFKKITPKKFLQLVKRNF